MAKVAAFLRGINVGGNRLVPMSELRFTLTERGLADVKTLLQSGNVVLQSSRAPAATEAEIESIIRERWGILVETMIRTRDQIQQIVEECPFLAESQSDPGHLLVFFAKSHAEPAAADAVTAAIRGPERAGAAAGHLFIYYPAGVGTSRLALQTIERSVGGRVTGRNWNTLLKVAALLWD